MLIEPTSMLLKGGPCAAKGVLFPIQSGLSFSRVAAAASLYAKVTKKVPKSYSQ
jgi:hypothetical protein